MKWHIAAWVWRRTINLLQLTLMKLIQERLLQRYELEILKNTLRYSTKSYSGSKEVNIPLDEIDISRMVYLKTIDRKSMFITGFFSLFLVISLYNSISDPQENSGSISMIVPLIIGLSVSSFFLYVKSKDVIQFPSTQSGDVEFFRALPTHREVNAFVSNLKNAVKESIRKQHAAIDPDIPIAHQISKLNWLLQIEVITEEEYTELKNQLATGKIKATNIGFNKDSIERQSE
jgi:hypothetical protein